MTITHNRSQLIQQVAKRAGVTQDVTAHVLDAVIEKIDELTEMGPLTIRGFGRFEKRKSDARQVRNPRTGELLQVAPSSRLKFRAATPRA